MRETGTGGFEIQDVKTNKISPADLDFLKERTGSYEALFSKRAIKYKEMGLKDRKLTEGDMRKLILDEYTFLKRPVYVIGNDVFAGNDKKTVEQIKERLRG